MSLHNIDFFKQIDELMKFVLNILVDGGGFCNLALLVLLTHMQNTAVLQTSVFLLGIHSLLVINI
jgi:hypothetical protein